ncbi:unnamed protein product [Amoebophrya sp. A25]|nr:unnamed protein product [Amoebophrya sp. A25]|eukprot:GSA25T00011089001.1
MNKVNTRLQAERKRGRESSNDDSQASSSSVDDHPGRRNKDTKRKRRRFSDTAFQDVALKSTKSKNGQKAFKPTSASLAPVRKKKMGDTTVREDKSGTGAGKVRRSARTALPSKRSGTLRSPPPSKRAAVAQLKRSKKQILSSPDEDISGSESSSDSRTRQKSRGRRRRFVV